MKQTRHNSVDVARTYLRDADHWRNKRAVLRIVSLGPRRDRVGHRFLHGQHAIQGLRRGGVVDAEPTSAQFRHGGIAAPGIVGLVDCYQVRAEIII